MKDFVGGVSEKLIAQSKADPGRAYLVAGYIYAHDLPLRRTAFDPKPFIRTFEAAVDKTSKT